MSDATSAGTSGELRDLFRSLPPEATGRQLWEALGSAGRIAWMFPDGDASAGVVPERLAQVLAAAGERFSFGSTMSLCVQAATTLPLLASDPGSGATALAQALSGKAVIALAATDTGAGSDLASLSTRADIGEHGIRITGAKRWINNAVDADHLLVLARHRPGPHFTNFTWYLVPADAPGVTVRPSDTELFDGSGTGDIDLHDVRLGPDSLIGRTGMGFPAFIRHIGPERLAGAMWAVELCRSTLDSTLAWLRARPHGDGTLWDLDSVRQRFAAGLTQVTQLSALCAGLRDRVVDGHDNTAAALLKAAAGTTVNQVMDLCGQLQGSHGFSTLGVQRLRSQAAIFAISGGATEVVQSIVADSAQDELDRLRLPDGG
ncbi:acyl-CoA dehydrogenase [Streptomyces sp. SID14515]|uniref:acyl-CoA dehydrogenase family protein n=1 Tax=Streptomyces sp. SID14515 TaxID=2706074 RepID=UPI0013CAFBF0|nr:acyl-CoA dehydrogenase [Streptomyces sp. SID14515]NEB39628.1 acyl-CoA dehydrogenase [Streptomyces sp. SID14515]